MMQLATSPPPAPPFKWRPKTFLALSVAVAAILILWVQVESVRMRRGTGYLVAWHVVSGSRARLNYSMLALGPVAGLFFLGVWSAWKVWRRGRSPAEKMQYNVTRIQGAITSSYFSWFIGQGLTGSHLYYPHAPLLVLAVLLLSAAPAVPIGLWGGYILGRYVYRLLGGE